MPTFLSPQAATGSSSNQRRWLPGSTGWQPSTSGGGTPWGTPAAGSPTPWGPATIDTGIQPSPVFDPTSLQVMRNQIRASVPTALGSQFRHTAPGVSTSLGTRSDILGQQLAGRMAGEDAAQQAMLQGRTANAQNILAGQTAATQAGMGLAGGALSGLGIGQDYQYGMANLGLQRQQEMWNTLSQLLGALFGGG